MKALKKLVKAMTKKAPKKTAKKVVKKATKKPTKPKKVPKKIIKKPAKKVVKKAPKAAKKPAKKPEILEFQQSINIVEEKRIVRTYPVLEGGNNERLNTLLPILKELVKKGTISDWTVNFQHVRSSNLYVERGFAVEDELTGIREDIMLTIFERFDDGMGEAQLPIVMSDPNVMRQRILDAKEMCIHSKKRAFDLPKPDDVTFPQSYDEKVLKNAFNGNGMQTAHDILHQAKATVATIHDVQVVAAEFLTSAGTVRVLNSNGVDVSYHKSTIYVEFVMVGKAKEEREFLASRTAVSPEQLDIQGLLLQQAQIVRDSLHAQPNPGFAGDVLFAGPSVTELFAPHHDFNPLVSHTFARLHHMGLSSFKIGQPIGHFIGESLTITSNPQLALGLATAPVDAEGTPLRPVEIIRSGVFVNYVATSRYAQYLNVPITGAPGNIQVSAGATREQHLRGNNYFEIVSFSWFNPNSLSGDVSAEIRLGYHWVNGRKTAFRGGTFSGNVFKDILNARFSKEVMQSGEYYGPRAIMFKGARINKAE